MLIVHAPALFRDDSRFIAMTIWPFIFLKDKSDFKNKDLLRHEEIHIAQQKELLLIPFFFMYLYFYLNNRFKHHMKHFDAYKNNPFEIEAHKNAKKKFYLYRRPFFAWLKYMNPND